MKAISEHLFRRGRRGTLYLRRRIPTHLLDAFPHSKREFLVSLRTSDLKVAKSRQRAESHKLDLLFERAGRHLEQHWPKREVRVVNSLTQEQLDELAKGWVHAVLQTDEDTRQAGLDDEAYAELDARIRNQLAELRPMLARGQVQPALPAMYGYLHLCGIDAQLSAKDERQAAYSYLQAVVRALELQAERQAGRALRTVDVAPAPAAQRSWDEVFAAWRDYVHERPKATTIACATAWRGLEAFARTLDVLWPAHVTPKLMNAFVDHMRASIGPKTLNERLRKVRAVFRIAVGKELLSQNPAAETLGVKLPSHLKGRTRRLPFSAEDVATIFSSPIYTQHLRSRGQSAEASYWLPLLMYYSGARPEEIAGLELGDLQEHPDLGWYLEVTDMPTPEDAGLFGEDDAEPDVPLATADGERRRLKNVASRRRVPLPQAVLGLGLLDYAEAMRRAGHRRLFPDLQADSHGKLSGAHAKFFGRWLRLGLGITNPNKSLYSLRHRYKDILQIARVPSRVAKRLMGHASGDGQVHDGYGSDIPLEQLFEHVNAAVFPATLALPWRPGRGFVQYMQTSPKADAAAR